MQEMIHEGLPYDGKERLAIQKQLTEADARF